jgi:signal transduction histidine kinase
VTPRLRSRQAGATVRRQCAISPPCQGFSRLSKKAKQICDELGRTVGAARDLCAVAWSEGESPELLCASGSVESVLQQSAESLIGKPAATLFAGGERAVRDLSAACVEEAAAEQRPLLRSGQPFDAQLLLRGVQGGTVALIRDLSAGTTQADASLRAEDLARFASLVAHEVRNPLSAVKIALQTLERHGALGPNDLRRASIALREVLNIELLLNEVLEYARPPTLSMVPGDPRTPVREALEGVEAEWGERRVTFLKLIPTRMGPALLDPVRVKTAAKILCRQAAVATEEAGGGAVEVSVREMEGGWELSVGDRGRTLPPELRERAFVPFTPQRARGSGLGLAVVLRISREHGGTARIEERVGGGNVIKVTFSGSG